MFMMVVYTVRLLATKAPGHQGFFSNKLFLVLLCAFVSWWPFLWQEQRFFVDFIAACW